MIHLLGIGRKLMVGVMVIGCPARDEANLMEDVEIIALVVNATTDNDGP